MPNNAGASHGRNQGTAMVRAAVPCAPEACGPAQVGGPALPTATPVTKATLNMTQAPCSRGYTQPGTLWLPAVPAECFDSLAPRELNSCALPTGYWPGFGGAAAIPALSSRPLTRVAGR